MMEMLEEMSLSEGLLSDISFAGSQAEPGPALRSPRAGPLTAANRPTKVRSDLSPKNVQPIQVQEPMLANPVGTVGLKPEVGGAGDRPEDDQFRTSHFNTGRHLQRINNSSQR